MNLKIFFFFRLFGGQQFWNDATSGGIRSWPRKDIDNIQQPVQQIDSSYDVVDVPNAPRKNCTGSGGNCIPKCFAEKGNRGFPGIPGLPGPKGSLLRAKISLTVENVA